MNYRKLNNELFAERQQLDEEILLEQEKKKICSNNIRKLRKKLHVNEEMIYRLFQNVIDENEANEETVEALKVEIEDMKYGSFKERM